MKTISLYILMLTIGQLTAQEVYSAIELTELNIVYRDYPNKIRPAISGNCKGEMIVTAENAVIKASIKEHVYELWPDNGRSCKVFVMVNLDGKMDTVGVHRFRVADMPKPSLYWGPASSGTYANPKERMLFAKYPPTIPLNALFKIVSWTVECEGQKRSGRGSRMDDSLTFLENASRGTEVIITCQVKYEHSQELIEIREVFKLK